MSQKEKIVSSIARINLGILFIFNALFLLALHSDDFYLNLPLNAVSIAVVFPLLSYLVFSGLREFNRHRAELKIDGKVRIIKYIELVPNVLGFTLLGTAAYLLSFYNIQTISLPNGGTHTSAVHQYSSQAGILFVTGMGIVILTMFLYNYLIPKQMTKEPEVSPRVAGMIEDL